LSAARFLQKQLDKLKATTPVILFWRTCPKAPLHLEIVVANLAVNGSLTVLAGKSTIIRISQNRKGYAPTARRPEKE
jgi:hypothetical protein